MARRLTISGGALVGIAVSFAALAVAFGWLVLIQIHQRQETRANLRAIAYICSTTGVLDDLVQAAGSQIAENLASGTYQKLEQRGIVSAIDIARARESLAQYHRADLKLKSNASCRSVLLHP